MWLPISLYATEYCRGFQCLKVRRTRRVETRQCFFMQACDQQLVQDWYCWLSTTQESTQYLPNPCLMRGWGLDMRLRTSWLCMVAKLQTTVLQGSTVYSVREGNVQLQPDPRASFRLLPISTVHTLLLFLVLVVNSTQFQILHGYTLLFYPSVLMCSSEPLHLKLHMHSIMKSKYKQLLYIVPDI